APDDLRRRCIVLAARHSLQADSYQHRVLLGYIARKRAGMSLEEIESVLPAQGQRHGHELVSCLIGQVEATWAALDDDGRARLLPRLDWIASQVATARA